MTDDFSTDDVWQMASCLLGNCCFRLSSRGEGISVKTLLAELEKMNGSFSAVPGGEYLPLRFAIEQLQLASTGEQG
ncbi:hypothetical protein [Erwinia billingiae]|uniref:hypothetical protein n=1 Tax=Erwinia billingiae TaxID=182337 RepID=UPI003209B20C